MTTFTGKEPADSNLRLVLWKWCRNFLRIIHKFSPEYTASLLGRQ